MHHAVTVVVCKLCRQSSLNSVDFGKIPRGCKRRQVRPQLDQPTTQHLARHRFRGWNYRLNNTKRQVDRKECHP
jgi:hypothetical protein